jgi:hypothetical protein
MAIFLFSKDVNVGSFYKAADNIDELNYYNINLPSFKTITEDNSANYLDFKLGKKIVVGYNGNSVVYEERNFTNFTYENKSQLDDYIKFNIDLINNFLKNNPTNPLYDRWNQYRNQLISFNTESLTYPLYITLEQHFYNNNLITLSPLQLP